MKKLFFISLLILAVIISYCFGTFSNEKEKVKGEITKSIKKGDYKELAKYFSQTIDLTLPGNEGTYSNTQAEMILKDFFSKYPPCEI